MDFKLLLALCAGASLLLVGPATFADDDDDEDDDDSPRVQVMVNEKGELLTAEDDAVTAARSALPDPASVSRVDALSSLVPDNSQARQYNTDGSSYAQVGREHFKYLVVTFDEHGEPVYSHATEDQLEDEELGEAPAREKEQ